MDLLKNQLIDAVIESYSSEGAGIARVGGRVVFVEEAARGDAATLRILKVTARAAYAKIEVLQSPAAVRVTPDCSAAARCGGCVFSHLRYDEEFFAKKQRVMDALQRLGGCRTLPDCIDVPAENVAGYRNKALFPVADGPVFGFYRPRSHQVVPLENCEIQDVRASAAARAVVDWMARYEVEAYCEATAQGCVRHVFARTGVDGSLLGVVAHGPPVHARMLVEALREACPDACGVVWLDNRTTGNTVLQGQLTTLWGQDFLQERLGGLTFRVGVFSFFQVNRDQAEKLFALAVDFADCEEETQIVDLYCGAGTLTLWLAQRSRNVWGIEVVEQAVEDARQNADRNGLSARFLRADAADGLAQLRARGIVPEVITVDPPRKGLSPELVTLLGQVRPVRLVYISCNPATLARDIGLLREFGYTLARLAVVDMFPRTAHVECVVQLVIDE